MKSMATIIMVLTALLLAACGGGGTTVTDPGAVDQFASVDGYLSESGIADRAPSAADGAVQGAQVWCEDTVTGEVLGQDDTDSNGYFLINGLPADAQLALRFRYRAQGGLSDVEGEQPLNLNNGERRRLELRVRQIDADGDGEADGVNGEGVDNGRRGELNCNMRRLIEEGVPPVPEMNVIRDLLLGVSPEAEPLPALPLDDEGAVDDRDASELTGDFVVYGPDYLAKFNGRDTDNSLVLNAGDHRLAWGLYKIGGLDGKHVGSLSVECAPQSNTSEYFIGVSNYTRRNWEWSRPVSERAFTFELNKHHRHVSQGGNLYVLVAVFQDNACEFFAAQANVRDLNSGDRPHPRAPLHLAASDGTTEGGVNVHWRVLPRNNDRPIDHYLVLRHSTDRTVSAGNGGGSGNGFDEIGRTAETEYFDDTAREGVVYVYAVVAVSGDEKSGRSNADRGYWIAGADRPERFPLAGRVITEDGNGVGGVMIVVAHGDRTIRTISGRDGNFAVRGLPAGWYSVTPHLRGATFDPEAARVELPMGDDGRLIFVAHRANDGGGDGDGDGNGNGDGDPGRNP